MLSKEVLPAPFGPMIEISSPRPTERDTPSTARTPPKCFEMAEIASCSSPGAAFSSFISCTKSLAFPHPPLIALMPGIYGGDTADACVRMQSPICASASVYQTFSHPIPPPPVAGYPANQNRLCDRHTEPTQSGSCPGLARASTLIAGEKGRLALRGWPEHV